jgi:choline kinase
VKLAILAAGKPVHAVKPSTSEHVLSDIPAAKWTISVAGVKTSDTQIVAGYDFDVIQNTLPDTLLRFNPNWQTSGSIESFFCLDLDESEPLLLTYGDIIFRRGLVEKLAEVDGDVVVAWDSQFLNGRLEGIGAFELISVDGENVLACGVVARQLPGLGFFPGVVKFSPRALSLVRQIPENVRSRLARSHISELIGYIADNGTHVRAVECHGQWARIEEPEELVRFILGSKADTLIQLKPLVSESSIPSSLVIEIGEWADDREGILQSIADLYPGEDLVVRSSARAEDTFEESNAGAFLSVLDVSDKDSIQGAIERVIDSYPDRNPYNQVLVQPQVKGLIANGVVVTRDLGNNAPWLTVDFEFSSRSYGVTSGKSATSRTLNIFRPTSTNWLDQAMSSSALTKLPPWMKQLLVAVNELEDITHHSRLDIEFGIDREQVVHVFQVRPLTSRRKTEAATDAEFEKVLENTGLKWPKSVQSAGAQGREKLLLLSNMTDWNPAEILGVAPRQLATSIYEELITNRVWSESRASFGYRQLLDRPLLKEVAGRPYVDISASIESLLPAALNEEDSQVLLEFFLNWLRKHPDQHDKVEFVVVPTCLTPEFVSWAKRLSSEGHFSENLIGSYRNSLKEITQRAIRFIDEDFKLLTTLDSEFDELKGDTEMPRPEKIERVLSLCKRKGTFPFSNLARKGFIAVTLLRDAASAGIISSAAVDDFFRTIRTVSQEFREHAVAVRTGLMSWDEFLSTYGHLRPGTYDIISPRYDSEPERFLRPLIESSPPPGGGKDEKDADKSLWVAERRAFCEWIRKELGEFPDDEIEDFLRKAIEGRESAKFAFTRLLSWVLEEIKGLARDWDVSADEISYLKLDEILGAATWDFSVAANKRKLSATVELNRNAHRVSSQIKLPGFLATSDELLVFLGGYDLPNFVGQNSTIEKRVHIRSGETIGPESITGSIVFIEAADPGFDWIFGHNIAGLVTKFGGANSHMTIRAAEFGLPAAIGVGEALFENLVKYETIELDPTNQILRGL